MNPASEARSDAKAAAVEQWTADPCGSDRVAGEPGSREYFEALLDARREYAPWMAEEIDYAGAAGLDVLDVGCGQGIDLASYALAGANAAGVDLTPRHVELATAHTAALGLRATVVQGDAESLPFGDDSFDRASSNGVLHHTPDMPAALREVNRVLRPGGRATIIVYNRSSLHYWTLHFLMEGVLKGGLLRERSMSGVLSRGVEYSGVGARPLVNVYSPRQLRSMLEEAGFTGVQTTVRHYALSDSPLTGWMEGRIRRASNPALLDRIGRRAGWYVIGRGLACAP
jgi:ubiquinone/menaquinone biosynthesis C-methylase UbiE